MSKNNKSKLKKSGAKRNIQARVKKSATKKAALSSNNLKEEGGEELISKPLNNPNNFKASIFNKYMVTAFFGLLGGCIYFSLPYWSLVSFLSVEQLNLKAQQPTLATSLKKTNDVSIDQLASERQQLKVSLSLLMERIKAIETAVVEVKKLAQATTPPSEKNINSSALNNITGRLETLEKNDVTINELLKRIKQIKENEVKRKKDQTKILKKEMSQHNSEAFYQNTAAPNNAAALVLALENLRQAIASSSPFKKPLKALKNIAGENLNINTAVLLLTKYSASGIPSKSDLKQHFDKISGKIIQASRYNDDPGLRARLLNRLASLIVWRRVDGKGNKNSIDSIVASAESKLRTGNLKATVSILENLSKNTKAATIVKPWLIDAYKRIAADRALNSLQIHTISKLTRIDLENGQKK
jgi:hypothetical protein